MSSWTNSTAIADIFCSNALKNGLLAIAVPPEAHASLLDGAGEPIVIDLRTQRIERDGHAPIAFAINTFARQCLLEGVDELGYLSARQEAIARYEGARA